MIQCLGKGKKGWVTKKRGSTTGFDLESMWWYLTETQSQTVHVASQLYSQEAAKISWQVQLDINNVLQQMDVRTFCEGVSGCMAIKTELCIDCKQQARYRAAQHNPVFGQARSSTPL